MKRIVASLLSVVVLVACGDTSVIPNNTPDAGDTVAPELRVDVIDTTTSTITVEFEADEDVSLYYEMVNGGLYGPHQLAKNAGYVPTLVGNDCGTTYHFVAWVFDATENKSFDVYANATTKPCPVPPPTDTIDPIMSLTVLRDFTTANSARMEYVSSEDGAVTYTIEDGKGWVSTDTVTVVGKTAYGRQWDMLSCNTPYFVSGYSTDLAGNKSMYRMTTSWTSA